MEIRIVLEGRKRKELAQVAGDIVGVKPLYKGPPSYAYEADLITIDRNGMLIIPTETPLENIRCLVTGLREQGFEVAWTDEVEVSESATEPEKPAENGGVLVVQLPLDGFTETSLENLRLLVASKALLIQKALGVCDLSIHKTAETIDFPWFDRVPSPEEVKAYTHFLTLLCDMAKRQTRVLATEKPVDSEKYAFRCFLLRLGMIGEAYAETRRILLQNLSGNGSMKSSERKPPKEQTTPAHVELQESPPPPKVLETTKTRRFSFKKLLDGLKMLAMD